jgi:hypothetical protein
MIIGFSGKKQSGKDTAIREILGVFGKVRPIRVVRFADELKRIVTTCFDVRPSDFETEEGKQRRVHPSYKTVRELLQIIGTDVFRELDPDCWVNAYSMQVDRLKNDIIHETEGLWYPLILTPDVRFPNEVEAIHRLGGVVIRLTRNPIQDFHFSETALDGFEGFDAVLDNRQLTIAQQNAAMWCLLTEKGWLDRD